MVGRSMGRSMGLLPSTSAGSSEDPRERFGNKVWLERRVELRVAVWMHRYAGGLCGLRGCGGGGQRRGIGRT